MSDPTSPGAAGLTDEQAQELLARLRSAPVAQVVAEVLSALLNSASAKLGRRDARLLIDLSGLVAGHARRHLPADLLQQVDQALSQLRLEQVRAEGEAGAGTPEPNDLPGTPAPPDSAAPPGAATPAAGPPPAAPPSQPSASSRLWLPGRDF